MAQEHAHRRVTVVDDSPELLALFGDALRRDGVAISLFDEQATVQDLSGSEPDLLVIDLRLGEHRSGMEMIRLIRSHRDLRHVPVIVCSAALDEISRHEDEMSRIPRLTVLRKPFSLEELESCVARALAQWAAAARREDLPLLVRVPINEASQ